MAQNTPAKRENTENVVDVTDVTARFADWVRRTGEDQKANQGPSTFTEEQMAKILTAETEEDIDNADEGGTAYQGRDLEGFEMEIPDQELLFVESDPSFDAPFGYYMQFRGIALDDFSKFGIKKGEEITIQTGAALLITKLRAYQARGFLPKRLRIAGTKTGKGTVLKFRPVSS